MLKAVIFIHVISAIIGVGPTFFSHVLIRRTQSPEQLRHSMKVGAMLEFFPKIGGTIAVLSGLALIFMNDYGTFLQLWLIGSLVLYVLIQIIVVGFGSPLGKRLAAWVHNPDNANATVLPQEQRQLLTKYSNTMYVASALGFLLFVFMIVKPIVFE